MRESTTTKKGESGESSTTPKEGESSTTQSGTKGGGERKATPAKRSRNAAPLGWYVFYGVYGCLLRVVDVFFEWCFQRVFSVVCRVFFFFLKTVCLKRCSKRVLLECVVCTCLLFCDKLNRTKLIYVTSLGSFVKARKHHRLSNTVR